MENINTISKPVIDLKQTGIQIKNLRTVNGFSIHDIQAIFGFEYPQAVYAWEQGKNIPSIDNLLVLADLFGVPVENIVATKKVTVTLSSKVA
ncbi:MAG: helix-turn-helix transcriptional regulator [Treponema sp.]|uniref:helix-turn-helix domain-containing protein n=1 Tax=Treponema sp. TaxID=166 RepID=UPI00298E4CCA|nr:helix-turn-helix transcriptional regulator [Treponema sp.]MBR5933954.1 helix-turn-helix transcriptional regulator [Treponema sp.]